MESSNTWDSYVDGDSGGCEGKNIDGDSHRDQDNEGENYDTDDEGDEFELQLFLFQSPHSINSFLNTFLALRPSTDRCESCEITIDDGFGLPWVVELRILLSKPLTCHESYL